jgi:hypothetical protein
MTNLQQLISPSFEVDNFLFENHPSSPTCVPLIVVVTITLEENCHFATVVYN